jgi:hypothetical protein
VLGMIRYRANSPKPSMNQLMGALFQFMTSNYYQTVYKILLHHDRLPEQDLSKEKKFLKKAVNKILQSMRTLFALPATFNAEDLFKLIAMPELDGKGFSNKQTSSPAIQLLGDLLANEGRTHSSLLLRIHRQTPYIRRQRPAGTHSDYTYVAPCSGYSRRFVTGDPCNQEIVESDQWYDLKDTVFIHLMNKYGRDAIAGPSGSTRQWMNFVFELLGVEPTRKNLKLLLLCIISDFIPHFHTLPEILMVFSVEAANYIEISNPFTIDQDPREWVRAFVK